MRVVCIATRNGLVRWMNPSRRYCASTLTLWSLWTVVRLQTTQTVLEGIIALHQQDVRDVKKPRVVTAAPQPLICPMFRFARQLSSTRGSTWLACSGMYRAYCSAHLVMAGLPLTCVCDLRQRRRGWRLAVKANRRSLRRVAGRSWGLDRHPSPLACFAQRPCVGCHCGSSSVQCGRDVSAGLCGWHRGAHLTISPHGAPCLLPQRRPRHHPHRQGASNSDADRPYSPRALGYVRPDRPGRQPRRRRGRRCTAACRSARRPCTH